MSNHVPPSEVELKAWRDIARTPISAPAPTWGEYRLPPDVTDRLIDEIERLRATCKRAIPFIDRHPTGLPGNYENGQMIDELDKASEGEVWIATCMAGSGSGSPWSQEI
jgi:hypothetical protein